MFTIFNKTKYFEFLYYLNQAFLTEDKLKNQNFVAAIFSISLEKGRIKHVKSKTMKCMGPLNIM